MLVKSRMFVNDAIRNFPRKATSIIIAFYIHVINLLFVKYATKDFLKKSHLNDCLRTHTGKKPHVCKVCNGGFTRKDLLNKHLRTHNGENPHAC